MPVILWALAVPTLLPGAAAQAQPYPTGKAGITTYFRSNRQDELTAQSILSAANLTGSKFLAGPGGHCTPPAPPVRPIASRSTMTSRPPIISHSGRSQWTTRG